MRLIIVKRISKYDNNEKKIYCNQDDVGFENHM